MALVALFSLLLLIDRQFVRFSFMIASMGNSNGSTTRIATTVVSTKNEMKFWKNANALKYNGILVESMITVITDS